MIPSSAGAGRRQAPLSMDNTVDEKEVTNDETSETCEAEHHHHNGQVDPLQGDDSHACK
jgi:hypothetical protein